MNFDCVSNLIKTPDFDEHNWHTLNFIPNELIYLQGPSNYNSGHL